MIWESWSAFWAMGGAAPYVWGSYGLTFLLIAVELVHLFYRRRDTLTRLRRWRRATAQRPAATANPSAASTDAAV